MKDRVYISDLRVKCIIGTKASERKVKQTLIINVAMECDLGPSGESDRLEDTVNYMKIRNRIMSRVESSRFFLIERIAREVAEICLADKLVKLVRVRVDKPGAIPAAISAGVEIERKRRAARGKKR